MKKKISGARSVPQFRFFMCPFRVTPVSVSGFIFGPLHREARWGDKPIHFAGFLSIMRRPGVLCFPPCSGLGVGVFGQKCLGRNV